MDMNRVRVSDGEDKSGESEVGGSILGFHPTLFISSLESSFTIDLFKVGNLVVCLGPQLK